MPRRNFMTGSIYRGRLNPQKLETKSFIYEEKAPSFLAPEPIDRLPISPDKLQAMELDKEGVRVQLGKSSLKGFEEGIEKQLFGYDENDTAEEKKKKKADTLAGLKNKATNPQLTSLVADIALVLDSQNLTSKELGEMKKILDLLKITDDYKDAFTHRIFTYQQYDKEAGMANTFILKNAKDINAPIEVSEGKRAKRIPLRMIHQYLKPMRRRRIENYLDIKNFRIISREQAVKLVNNGVDGGKLNGLEPPASLGQWAIDKDVVPPYMRDYSMQGLAGTIMP